MPYTDIPEKALNAVYALLPRRKPLASQAQQSKLIAHRGAHDQAKGIIENTLPAFARAMELGCDGIELDIQTSRDGEWMVCHDDNLQRLFGIAQRIADLSAAEIRQLAPMIPTLQEVIAQCAGKQILFIELKTRLINEAKLLDVLGTLQAGKDFFLISLQEEILAGLEKVPKKAQLLVPIQWNTAHFCQLCLDKHYGGVLGHYLLMSKRKLDQLRAENKTVGVGFVDSKNSLYRELQRDIPWLFSNAPARVLPYLQALRNR
ncbi:MAG: glycerophosphodiester phosphodiesterase family protein [Legionellaceae bacterium]|nr:glycerophosphodiester phosphodiesterase family protein [Legionellaceae bacterium]